MDKPEEKRHTARREVDIVAEVPALSGLTLVSEPSGVYRVVAAEEPGRGAEAEFTLHLGGARPVRYLARVAWLRKNQTIPVTWSIGLAVRPREEERRSFSDTLARRGKKSGAGRWFSLAGPAR